jgi:hypothetical protein
MRKVLFLSVFFLVTLAAMAQTQEFPRAEVFGGYSYFRANPEGFNLNGWNANVAGNLTHWFGVEGDVSGHYASPVSGIDINSYTFMGGPKLAYRMDKIVPFAHFLIGASRAGTNEFGDKSSDHALAAIIGGGVDLALHKSFAVRVAQVDYLMTRFDLGGFDDQRQNNFRFSAGLVFRLGNK